mgnify:CR=1 FL=1
MKREFNTIIADRRIIRHLSKDNLYNTGKKLYSNTLERNPSNYFLSSYKYNNLKDNNNKVNYKKSKKRKYSIRNPKVNHILDDLYNTINNINHLNRKIQKILYSPDRKINLNHAHTINNNKQDSDTEKTNYASEKNIIDNDLKYKLNDSISNSLRRNKDRNLFNKIEPNTYQIRKKNNNRGINSYNNSIINDNKFKTIIAFRRPDFKTITKRKSYIKDYKSSSQLRKENTNENGDKYFSNYKLIISLFNNQNSNNDNNLDFLKYYNQYEKEQESDNEKIKNMKLEINDINRIKKLDETQDNLNYIIKQINQKDTFNTIEDKINQNITERKQNYKDILFLEKYKQMEIDKLNSMYDTKRNNGNYNNNYGNNSKIDIETKRNSHIYSLNNYNNKYESEINNYNDDYENKYIIKDYLREKVKKMHYKNNDEPSKENNMNQFYINLKLNGNNNRKISNRNRHIHRNNTNYIFNKYFKINDNEKIDNDKYIYKVKEKDHTNGHEIYDYKNAKKVKNIFRSGSRNRNISLNTDLNIKNKDKIIDNLKSLKYKKYNILENIIPFNNSRFSDAKKDIIKYSINNYNKSVYNFKYDYSTNNITSRKRYIE